MEDCRAIKGLLEKYEGAADQCLNRQKTEIFFSSNTKAHERKLIKEEVGARVNGCYEKYLGLLAMIGRSKYNTF